MGGLTHESRERNEVFHDSSKFFERFHFSRKISAGWNDCSAYYDTRSLGALLYGGREGQNSHKSQVILFYKNGHSSFGKVFFLSERYFPSKPGFKIDTFFGKWFPLGRSRRLPFYDGNFPSILKTEPSTYS